MAIPIRNVRSGALIVVLLALPVLMLRASLQEPSGGRSSFDRAVWKIGAPLEAGLSFSAGWIGSFFQRWIFQANLLDENRRLEVELRQLKLERARLERLEGENTELRRAMQLRQRRPEDMLAAEVVSGESSPFFRRVKVRIDRGDKFVQPGMAVLDPDGVVGRVERCFTDESDVMLVTDPQSRVAVEVARLPACFGVLEGLGEHTARVKFPCEDEIKVGDLIQTSGVDDLFPKAHSVGRVVHVEVEAGAQMVKVVPVVRFDTLQTVWVVLADAPAPDPNAGRPSVGAAGSGWQPMR